MTTTINTQKRLRISEIYPSIQGEGIYAGLPTTFIRLQGCPLRCVATNTPVLMADWSWKNIQDILPGEYVMGFAQVESSLMTYIPSLVKHIHSNGIRPTITITTDGNERLTLTRDHKVYAHKQRQHWYRAENLLGASLRIVAPNPIPTLQSEFRRGWLAGYLAGDGNFHLFQGRWTRLKAASIDADIRDRLFQYLTELNLPVRRIIHQGARIIEAIEVTASHQLEELQKDLLAFPWGKSYAKGWLSGFYDAEGHLDGSQVRLSQSHLVNEHNILLCHQMCEILKLRCTEWRGEAMSTLTISPSANFFSLCEPACKWKVPSMLNTRNASLRVIDKIEESFAQPVYDLTTTTENYIAGGFPVHNCTWCDSGYTLPFTQGDIQLTVPEVVGRINELAIPNVLITGGEPLAQSEVNNLFSELLWHSDARIVSCETSGGYRINRVEDWEEVSWVLDIKCPGSGMVHWNKYDNLDILRGCSHDIETYQQVKFVVKDIMDCEWSEQWLPRIDPETHILYSPVWQEGNIQWLQELADWIVKLNHPMARMSLQIHKVVWPLEKRSV